LWRGCLSWALNPKTKGTRSTGGGEVVPGKDWKGGGGERRGEKREGGGGKDKKTRRSRGEKKETYLGDVH